MSGIIGRLREQLQSMSTKHASTPIPSSTDTTLCTTCAALDVQKILRDGLPESGKVSLGTLQDVIEKRDHCALCRLVADLVWRRWRLDDFPNLDVRGVNCAVSASGHGRLVPKLDKKREAHRMNIHASPRPLDISSALMTARAALHLDLQLLNEESHKVGRSKDLHGRRVEDKVDPHLIKQWIDLCEKAHGDACRNVSWKVGHEELPEFVRMVDVVRMALVQADRNCRYVALSYVWGGPADDYSTTTANAAARNRPYGLQESLLPATIIDAVRVTRLIGERYLWVDALCIVQDSQEDKVAQIAVMDRVYGQAVVVTVAASGTSVRDGLAGVRAGSRITNQHIECVQGLYLAIPLPPLPEAVVGSTWNTRGWTFQEALVSSRRLVFTKHQVYFQCEKDLWCEDLVVESKTLKGSFHPMRYSRSFKIPISLQLSKQMNFRAHQTTIEEYTHRRLTVGSDIIAAATALMNAITRAVEPPGTDSKEAFRFGMWIRHLDLSLLWHPTFDSVHTRRIMPNGDRSPWPSWAWSEWKGAVQYGIETVMLQGMHADGHPPPVGSLATAWHLVDEDGTMVQLNASRISQSWIVDGNPNGLPPYQYAPCGSDPGDPALDFAPPAGTLVFRTQCARFQVVRVDDSILAEPSKMTAHTIFHILPVDSVHSQSYAGRIILPVPTSPTVLGLIVLSRCAGIKGLHDESTWGDRYYGCFLHVMAVRRMGEDSRVSERVGVGVVVESAWMKAGAEEGVVLLA